MSYSSHMPHMSLFIIRCFVFILFCLSVNSVWGSTLHTVFVGDTVNEMAGITKPDIERWTQETRIIAKHAKMSLQQKVFVGRGFNKKDVSFYIQKMNLKKDDAVIFYFTGHGYRTVDMTSPFPVLTFTLYQPGIEMEWVITKIKNKKPRFALVMSDCCNNYIERGFSSPNKKIQITLHPKIPDYDQYEQLFGKAKGFIAISSCSAGQFSYGSHLGGLYTQCFFASLHRELTEECPSWRDLLRRCNGYISHIQKPIIKIY